MLPKVSIIIPCYNIEKYISKCIDSVLNQTYNDFELLLIDDGSTDNTLSIIKDYQKQDHRLRVFSHFNQGVSYTRNIGIDNANGELIMFIDGDDYIKKDYLENHIISFKEDYWVISGFINVNNLYTIENIYFKELLSKADILKRNTFIKLLEYYSISSPCCRIYENSIIQKNNIRFNELMSFQEDLNFNLDYLKYINNIKLINYYGYYYVEHAISSTNRYHLNLDLNTQIFEKLIILINNSNDQLIVDEFIFQTYMKRISNIFNHSNIKKKRQKTNDLKRLFNEVYFEKVSYKISLSEINILLKYLLKFKNTTLIYYYFKITR